ncbi:endonuclease/exonuclease/phosphatase family protein [Chelativorans sp. AA-79]|uniref:endonuclease/exonuclease/phosphatase family protein n=1 Tax=Chelativorans sp. AA-79 TaxID=3028735 RepID=UPI0023F63E5C|nr:endonuclease/exonuclease/phosphatase family protein [Chelativorans sp. AA-79]WEX09478.1 endonuclease/exonuclease/phosphatase family protein [Chelativorans sp. AA-79]
MTWNIHGGVGSDGRRDLQRIVDFVRRHEPDLVALQEVGSRRDVDGAAEAFAFLADTLGNHATESRLVTAPDGNYGHALISRWPLNGTVCHDISYRRREPRAAIEAVAETPFGPLHVVAAHLGLSFAERRHQAQLLAALLRTGSAPTVLLGDLNDWVWRGSVQKILNNLFPGHTHFKTFPGFWPVFALDRIYCRPSDMLARHWTDPAARAASDHLPVIAELAMEGVSGPIRR